MTDETKIKARHQAHKQRLKFSKRSISLTSNQTIECIHQIERNSLKLHVTITFHTIQFKIIQHASWVVSSQVITCVSHIFKIIHGAWVTQTFIIILRVAPINNQIRDAIKNYRIMGPPSLRANRSDHVGTVLFALCLAASGHWPQMWPFFTHLPLFDAASPHSLRLLPEINPKGGDALVALR